MSLTSLASEYYVAAELLRRGYHASITIGNAKSVDIIAAKHDGSKSVSIQVKSTVTEIKRNGKISWQLTAKADTLQSENLFYVFVRLGDLNSRPEFYIVASTAVASFVSGSHKTWLAAPGIKGQPHNDTSIRIFDLDANSSNKEAWHLLGLD